jgi:hypothetical protein
MSEQSNKIGVRKLDPEEDDEDERRRLKPYNVEHVGKNVQMHYYLVLKYADKKETFKIRDVSNGNITEVGMQLGT